MRRANGKPPLAAPGSGLRGARVRAGLLAAAVVAGVSARVDPDAARWFGLRGPTCPLGACLGPLICPGCGLLRSTAASLQGDFAFAFTLHPVGPATALLLLGALLLHLDILRRGHERPRHRRWQRCGGLLFAASVLAGWALRFCL
jgi:hypothetical protein